MIEVEFLDAGRTAQNKPNPKFPNGIDVSYAELGDKTCTFNVPYPAPRCGAYRVTCRDCKFVAVVSVAGRADDARTITLPCKGVQL